MSDKLNNRGDNMQSFANHELVTLAVYRLGGESKPIDTEDIAKEAMRVAFMG